MADLPTWDEMSDLDKGAALLHVWKRDWEGVGYAIENYPARYFDDPALTGLSPREACQHAYDVTQGHDDIVMHVGSHEHERLYDLALDADRKRTRSQLGIE